MNASNLSLYGSADEVVTFNSHLLFVITVWHSYMKRFFLVCLLHIYLVLLKDLAVRGAVVCAILQQCLSRTLPSCAGSSHGSQEAQTQEETRPFTSFLRCITS